MKLLKVKLKAALAEQRQWAKEYNRAERAMLRVGKQIDDLQRKINAYQTKVQRVV